MKFTLDVASLLCLGAMCLFHTSVAYPQQGSYSLSQITPEQLSAISEAQIRISENRDALNDGDVVRDVADARVARILKELNATLSITLTEYELMGISVNSVKRTQSFFDGVNFLRLGLIAVFTLLSIVLVGRRLMGLLVRIPKIAWELTLYVTGMGLLGAQAVGLMQRNQFWAFFACLLIAGGLKLTLIIHESYFDEDRFDAGTGRRKIFSQYVCPLVLFFAFGTATLVTESNWLGAFTVSSLMVLIGFFSGVTQIGYVLGFRSDDALGRATPTGLLIMTAFMGLRGGSFNHRLVQAFEPGAVLVGGLTGYLGLLIGASHWYKKRLSWLSMQLLVLAIFLFGVLGGALVEMKSVQIISGVFLVLWTIEKMLEIPGKGFVPWTLKLMAASGVLYLIVTYVAPLYASRL